MVFGRLLVGFYGFLVSFEWFLLGFWLVFNDFRLAVWVFSWYLVSGG